ncbi:Protein of unknown function DUF4817 [Cinara cedri]|uniref:DUF4817 domain-containing protein n=1 Tax=Cinara cedri TaxID=506608 RepID=A0A5E4M0K1_9HEMI|nr:Protein of unknown function DUF4817 [Cinara cedri]
MNNAEKVELVLIYGECQHNVCLAAMTYAERYPERYHPPYNYVLRLLQGLNEEGRFPGRQIIQQMHRANIFIWLCSKNSKKHKMHPYKIDFVQHLRAGDSIRRLEFIAWFNIKFYDNPLIVNQILWTDESKFTNNGIMNKQNNRYWDNTNPHWSHETNFQIWGINVWCGLVGGKLIGPFFYDGTLNGRRYFNFLTNELPRLLDDVSLDTQEHVFQQDGAPAHKAIIVRRHLDQIFPNRCIDPPVNLQDLKNKIQAACDILSEDQIKDATSTEFLRRLGSCLEHDGENFEQFIRYIFLKI